MVELNFKPGDFVRLRLAQDELDGRVLENKDARILLLKLSSGYNIGVPRENILAGRVLKKFSEEKKVFSLEKSKGLPSIGMIITGGTIASRIDYVTGGVKPLTESAELIHLYPDVFSGVNVKKISSPFMILSEDVNFEKWSKLAESVKDMLDDTEIEGIIITHGTDTLHYTSAVLSFFLRNLNKPVVLTYSQRSIDRASSDAHLNLQCSVRMALSNVAEVMLVGHGSLDDDFCYALRGTKVRKMHTSRRDAFRSVNFSPIARVWPDRVEYLTSYSARNRGKVVLDTQFSDKVALLKFYPGQDASILDFYALKYKGIVIEGTGFGHVASSDEWMTKLKKHIRNGLVVCMTSQCVNGRTNGLVYTTGRNLTDAGVIYLEDMPAETAFVKLGWVLGHYGWKVHVREKMLENIAGEIGERTQI